MNTIVPYIFEDQLVRSVMRNDQPWFVGRDVCQVLDIKNESQALARLDDDERAGYVLDTQFGAKETIVICEAGVFRLIFGSRKPEAERFKRWLAHEVLPAIRKTGGYNASEPEAIAASETYTIDHARTIDAKLAQVRTARSIFGVEAARAMWAQVGLPPVRLPKKGGENEGWRCLWHLLDAPFQDDYSYRWAMERALNGDGEADAALRKMGIVPKPEEDGFLVCSRTDALEALFGGTEWSGYHWGRVLKRLPGARMGQTVRMGQKLSASTFIPAKALDLATAPAS